MRMGLCVAVGLLQMGLLQISLLWIGCVKIGVCVWIIWGLHACGWA